MYSYFLLDAIDDPLSCCQKTKSHFLSAHFFDKSFGVDLFGELLLAATILNAKIS
jgi:hypothetical protein